MTKAPFGIIILAAVSLLTACQPRPILQETHSFPDGQWTYDDTLDFEVNVEDTSSRYDLFLDLEHSPDFPNQNLYIRIYTSFPDGQRPAQLVSLEMADRSGAWFGRCNQNRCKLTIPIQTQAYFNQPGPYRFTIEQYSRQEALPGIQSLGMRILPAPEPDRK